MQFSTELSSSGGIICKKKNQEYSLLKLFENLFWESECPVLIEKWQCKGGELPKIWGAGDVAFMDNNPYDWIILATSFICVL